MVYLFTNSSPYFLTVGVFKTIDGEQYKRLSNFFLKNYSLVLSKVLESVYKK